MLYSENTYFLTKSKSKWISTGLQSNFTFVPVIKLGGHRGQRITFTEEMWQDFLNQKCNIMCSFAQKSQSPEISCSGIKISVEWIENNSKKIIKIQHATDVFYISYEALHEMWKLADVILSRIELLKLLDYNKYYGEILQCAGMLQGNVRERIEYALNSTISEQASITKELMMYEMDRIFCDLDFQTMFNIV